MQDDETMQVARVHHRGGPDALRIERVPIPVPGLGEVLVRVESASVNFSDVKRRRGDAYPFTSPLPFVPGGEVAGTIAAVGDGVGAFTVGQAVFGLAGGDGRGGYAEYALALASQINALPPGLDADRASTLIVAGGTAMLLIEHVAALQAGETILIPAALGAVGRFALQLARRRGAARIVAAVGSQERVDAAVALGADVAVDYTRDDWPDVVRAATGGRGVDVLLEASGGDTLEQGLATLAPFGRAIVYGAASGKAARLGDAALERFFYAPAPNQSLVAFNIGGWFIERPEAAGQALGALIGAVIGGEVFTPPITTMPLARAADAHRLVEQRLTSGKIVLKP